MTIPLQRSPVVLLGAGSQIASFLLRQLADADYSGTCHSRTRPARGPNTVAPSFAWQALDVTAPETWRAPEQAIVISCVPIWLLEALLPRLAGARQLIAFSSTSVFSKRTSPDAQERALAQRLENGERTVREACAATDVNWTILRPTLVYGEGRDRNVSAIARFIKRFGFFPITRPGRGLRQPVHADDLAAAAVAAIGNPQAENRAFDLTGGETLSYRSMVERIFMAMERRPRIIALPARPLAWIASALRRLHLFAYGPALFERMNQDLAFDSSDAMEALHYRPRAFRPAASELGLETSGR